MIALALAALLLQQAPDTVPGPPAPDPIYDSPATAELVRRAIAVSGSIPSDLLDYRATVRSSLFLTIASDTMAGGDLPGTVDEVVSEVRWNRQGSLHQTVLGHRTRVLVPMPYTLATILQQPWVVPHLYGTAIFSPFAGPQAVNPFGPRGPEFYSYEGDDPIRLRVQGELVTLIPVRVRPRQLPQDARTTVVLGTFYLDRDRAAVAQARYGFAGGRGDLPRTMGSLETFLELENGLWEGRYWLPFRQRREIYFSSPFLGGGAVARVVNQFTDFEFNTGWFAEGERVRLVWGPTLRGAFAGWEQAVGEDAARYAIADFADLRFAIRTEGVGPQRTRVRPHYARGNHLFRYNRVEGPFLGVGGRIVPPNPLRNRWEVYGTAGWAFAEGTARGELAARWGAAAAPSPHHAAADLGAEVTAYRRLLDIQAFRPTHEWDLIYTLPAALWGSDVRDYYDATGASAFLSGRHGRWSGRLGGRVERHDSVRVNTTRFLFGTAGDFGPLALVEPGTHAAVEATGGYTLGPGAFGVGNSAVLRAEGEQGFGDFRFSRLAGLLSLRYSLGPLTLASRTDAGHVFGAPPPQRLFRFGSLEGLRGYEPNEFGGSTAVLTRGRFLLGIPPRGSRPLARVDMFLIPPLRPSLVFLVESGWTWVEDDLAEALAGLRARPTEGPRSSIGFGVSLFDDAITVERLQPVGSDAEGRRARWYVGLTYWY